MGQTTIAVSNTRTNEYYCAVATLSTENLICKKRIDCCREKARGLGNQFMPRPHGYR